jgi:xanthine dehydrogenase accessory factor
MSNDKCVLVCGVDEAASAVARRLFGEGYAVALHRETAPTFLRRRMNFADAWYDGHATLDGIEARRADVNAEFLLGLQTREFIPLLRSRLEDSVERWPWDILVFSQEDDGPPPDSLEGLAEITIGLGPKFVAGIDCDLVIETEGPDPGAILRPGDPRSAPRTPSALAKAEECFVCASAAGQFRAKASIGVMVEPGALLGFIGEEPVASPVSGRIKGVARQERAVIPGAPIVEIALQPSARVAGIGDRNHLISRGVSFALEMDSEGVELLSFHDWR